jgi:ParB-like chromosome segregation protein Spo0J
MEVRDLSLDTIIPYARNPRKNDGAVDKVAASIKEFGWRSPIVVDEEMVILAGHTRYKAAKKLGLTEAPVHIAEGLTEAQKKAYRIADNRVAEEAEWDEELLRIELEDLGDFALMTAFDISEIERVLDLMPDVSEQDCPDDFKEIDEQSMSHKCPRCGFEFDE